MLFEMVLRDQLVVTFSVDDVIFSVLSLDRS